MYKVLRLFCFITIFQNCKSQNVRSDDEIVKTIDSLLMSKSYFKAYDLFNTNQVALSDFHLNRFKAITHNLFNQPKASNLALEKLFENHSDKISFNEAKDLLETKLSNHIKLFDYNRADSITEILIADYKSAYKEKGLWDVKNNGNIWKAIKNYPSQKIVIKDSSLIQLFKDKAGLKNLNAKVSNESYPFIFDTGANLSVVIESQAEKMRLDIIDRKVSVGTITGQRVNAKIGVASRFSINNIDFENVVFLVFPDKALYVPQIDYQIKGILGYPVLSAMKEVHFIENDIVYVPKQSQLNKPQNLAIQYLTPYINLKLGDGQMYPFAFDTGANTTFLYKPYFLQNKTYIENNFELEEVNFAGGGGAITIKGYKIPLEIDYNGSIKMVKNVSVIPEIIEGTNEFEYGNLGQDFINQFKTMIINFEKMFVHFE